MRTRQHASGDVSGFEPVLQKDARRVVGALSGAADAENDLLFMLQPEAKPAATSSSPQGFPS